eukprot:g1669.t1
MSKIYYRAGKPDKHKDPNGGKVGHIMGIQEYIANDETRVTFLKRFKESASFRAEIGWDKRPVEDYIKDWKEKIEKVKPADHVNEKGVHDGLMCTHLYEIGSFVGYEGDEKVRIMKKDGKEAVFDKKTETCVYDPSHDGPDIPDDVVAIQGFGEAAMLKVMRRRISEKLNIFTYVGDVVLALNPYMYIPAMINIAEPPNVKKYELGKDPNSYATAHFAYWGLRDPDAYNPVGAPSINQSCPVSGESGAGKTVSCTYIMKYLAKLSDWRMAELGRKKEGKDTTTLVGGVSPFLEGFGNAKTTMNDNSSRFGKFTKILFEDGMIVGAEMVHYLLEKARLVDQGEHERNYHVFYCLIKGATKEETARYNFGPVESYDMLMHGHTAIIENETKGGKNTYDSDRMNKPLVEGDPDKTGFRAAFTAAGINAKAQSYVWTLVAAILKLGNLHFKKDSGGSKVMDAELCSEVARLLGVKELAKSLVIYRIKTTDEIIDKPVAVSGANDNRNALIKAIYGHLFAWLFHGVCNKVLKPKDGASPAGFVGLLDIFGFEVFKKNSMEQLCINFANEKLQKLFNDHVFQSEKTVYKAQNIPDDCIPPYEDNTPCCHLIERSYHGFPGVLPSLNDKTKMMKDTPEENHQLDLQYCKELIKKWGRKKGPNPKLKKKIEKHASKNFYARKNVGNEWFVIRHFAGDVKYWIEGWVTKNGDRLPLQLEEMMSASSVPFFRDLFEYAGKSGSKTIAKTFVHDLGTLAKTLEKTNPHYVKCVKPNDIKFRPVDGKASFNAWKTYRQLRFAGVMEVCKIKMQGYPFRMPYDAFWNGRCVRNKYHVFANLDPSMDPKSGCESMCKLVMPGPRKSVVDGKMRPTWLLGKSWLFGKEFLSDTFTKWHQLKVVTIVQATVRGYVFSTRLKMATHAVLAIGRLWKKQLLTRQTHERVRLIQRTYVPFQSSTMWRATANRLSRLGEIIKATRMVQNAWRAYTVYPDYAYAWKAIVHVSSDRYMSALISREIEKVKTKLATNVMVSKLKIAVTNRRRKVAVQSRVRKSIAMQLFLNRKRALERQRMAATEAAMFWDTTQKSDRVVRLRWAIVKLQSCCRGHLARRMYSAKRSMRAGAHAFAKMVVARARFFRLRAYHDRVAQWYRYISLRHFIAVRVKVFHLLRDTIGRFAEKVMLKKFVRELATECEAGDLQAVKRLLQYETRTSQPGDPPERRGRFYRISHLVSETLSNGVETFPLVNIREPVLWTSPIHNAVKSGNVDLVSFLLRSGSDIDVRNATGDTPLHSSCVCGDDAIEMTQRVLESIRSVETGDDLLWMLGMKAMNQFEQTVLDVALDAENNTDTVALLIENSAKATTDFENELMRSVDEEHEWEVLQNRSEEIKEEEEEHRRTNDPLYTYLTMDPKAGKYDPYVQRIKTTRLKQKRQVFSTIRSTHVAAIVLQAAYRSRLRKIAMRVVSSSKEMRLRVQRHKTAMEHRMAARSRRRQHDRQRSIYTSILEKERQRFDGSTVERASHFMERLAHRSEIKSEKRRALAKSMARKVANKYRNEGSDSHYRLENEIEGMLCRDFDDDDALPSPDLLTGVNVPGTPDFDPPGLDDNDNDNDEFDSAANVKSLPSATSSRTKRDSPATFPMTLGQLRSQIRTAVDRSLESDRQRSVDRELATNRNLNAEVSRLSSQIAALSKARTRTTMETLRGLFPKDMSHTKKIWYYRDLDGGVFGPFSSHSMSEWASRDYFDDTLECSLSADGPYISLGSLYPDKKTRFKTRPGFRY